MFARFARGELHFRFRVGQRIQRPLDVGDGGDGLPLHVREHFTSLDSRFRGGGIRQNPIHAPAIFRVDDKAQVVRQRITPKHVVRVLPGRLGLLVLGIVDVVAMDAIRAGRGTFALVLVLQPRHFEGGLIGLLLPAFAF